MRSTTPAGAAQLVLVVDDDPKIVNLVRAYLLNAGFEVATAADGPSALDAIRELRPDLVVLDLMLPGLDGISVTRQVRKHSRVPILMLTARGSVPDRVAGLSEGADDYMPKPFAPSELVARARAILRRSEPRPDEDGVVTFAGLTIDAGRLEVWREGAPLDLSLIEFRLLTALVAAGGRVLTRDQLLDALAGVEAEGVLERSVDVYVSRLRRKLGDDPERPRYVATVRGVGYRVPSTST